MNLVPVVREKNIKNAMERNSQFFKCKVSNREMVIILYNYVCKGKFVVIRS